METCTHEWVDKPELLSETQQQCTICNAVRMNSTYTRPPDRGFPTRDGYGAGVTLGMLGMTFLSCATIMLGIAYITCLAKGSTATPVTDYTQVAQPIRRDAQ